MNTSAEPPFLAGRLGGVRWRPAAYWLATVLVAAELGVGGIWDIARIPYVRDLVAHLGYPSYFLVLLGAWKVLGAVALLVPRRPLLKEWAYAGAFFTYTGAIVSHLATGYALGEVALLAVLTTLTVLSWALRPPSRRTTSPSTDEARHQAGWKGGADGAGAERHVGRELHVSDGENVSGWAVGVVGITLAAHGRQVKGYKAAEAEYRMHR